MCYYAGCVSLRLLLKLRWPTLSAVPERILCKPRQTDSGPTRHWSEPTLLHTVTWKDCRRENTLIRLYGSPEGQTKKCLLWFIYFLILIQLVFCFWRFFFFCQNILVSVFSRVKLCLIFPFLWNWQGKCVKLSEKHLHEKVFWYSVCKK